MTKLGKTIEGPPDFSPPLIYGQSTATGMALMQELANRHMRAMAEKIDKEILDTLASQYLERL